MLNWSISGPPGPAGARPGRFPKHSGGAHAALPFLARGFPVPDSHFACLWDGSCCAKSPAHHDLEVTDDMCVANRPALGGAAPGTRLV
jgi:hypothetical protein